MLYITVKIKTFNRLSFVTFLLLLLVLYCGNINFVYYNKNRHETDNIACGNDTEAEKEYPEVEIKSKEIIPSKKKNRDRVYIQTVKCNYRRIFNKPGDDVKPYIHFIVNYYNPLISEYGYWYYINLYYPNSTKILYYGIKFLHFAGLFHIDSRKTKNKLANIPYFIFFLIRQCFFRGIGSTRCFYNENFKYKFLGCEWYFGIGNVPYIGWIFSVALVCKPNFILEFLPKCLKDRITIHILDVKPLNIMLFELVNILLGIKSAYHPNDRVECNRCGSAKFIYYAITNPKNRNRVITTHHYTYMSIVVCMILLVGCPTIEIQITKYYNISINFICLSNANNRNDVIKAIWNVF